MPPGYHHIGIRLFGAGAGITVSKHQEGTRILPEY
jgi:hypothetical protein